MLYVCIRYLKYLFLSYIKNYRFYLQVFFLIISFYIVCLIIPGPSISNHKIEIKKGSGVNSITEQVYKEGFIYKRFKPIFKYTLRFITLFSDLTQGEFIIKNKSSLYDLMMSISNNKNIYYYKITIIEGITVNEALQIVNDNKILTGNVSIKINEGMLMPDTYFFTKGTTKDEIIQQMQNLQKDFINSLWEKRSKDFPLNNIHEVIVMSSLIEKEAGYVPERTLVASVFFNRMKIGIPLQTDPSVAYGVGKKEASKITLSDLKNNNPYNTYLFKGLPKNAIAIPSRSSILAVFYPEKTKYLYFVAKGDGTHIFSEQLSEHNKAVKKWRIIEKKLMNLKYRNQ